MLKRLTLIFIAAFVLNFIWEELHSVLYSSYQGAPITHLILFRAALFDAFVITLLAFSLFLLKSDLYRSHRGLTSALFVLSLVLFAVILEKWALSTSRWVYADTMPLIPYLNAGLTPAVQLGLLGYLAFKISLIKKAASRETA